MNTRTASCAASCAASCTGSFRVLVFRSPLSNNLMLLLLMMMLMLITLIMMPLMLPLPLMLMLMLMLMRMAQVLNLRLRMPIVGKHHHRNFVTKICHYEYICSQVHNATRIVPPA